MHNDAISSSITGEVHFLANLDRLVPRSAAGITSALAIITRTDPNGNEVGACLIHSGSSIEVVTILASDMYQAMQVYWALSK